MLMCYSSLRNQRDSPLLRLPAELCNKFYSYAFGEVQITPFICDHGKIFKVWRQGICIQPTRRRVYRANLAALLLVCRQIYVEVAMLPFQKFEFSLHYGRDSVIAFNLLMNTFSKEQRETIRHVVLCDGILPEMFKKMVQYWEKREKTAYDDNFFFDTSWSTSCHIRSRHSLG